LETTPSISSDRLLLRRWRPDDLSIFAALNADPRVMEFMPKVLSREESNARAERIQEHFANHGFGLWAVEIANKAPFIGFVGLSIPAFPARFTPCVEVGWRLAYDFWGHGYATEAANAAIDFGFTRLNLPEIVSFTVPHNYRSRRVMERLGMIHSSDDDFDHPMLAPGHPLCRHVLYRLARKT
jgi:RimJ/RimL family protein N-acetyltransferase